MSDYAADAQVVPMYTGKPWMRHMRITAVLTTAGAVLAASGEAGATDPAITLTKDGGTTGQYLLTYPKSPGYVGIVPTIYSPLGSIGQMYVKAKVPSSGTATLIFSTPAGVAAYGASGDEIILDLFIESRPKT